MEKIDIGLNVVPKLYLHVEGFSEDEAMGFEIQSIVEVKECEGGSILIYRDRDDMFNYEYHLTDTKKDVDEAFNQAVKYHELCVDYMNNLINNE